MDNQNVISQITFIHVCKVKSQKTLPMFQQLILSHITYRRGGGDNGKGNNSYIKYEKLGTTGMTKS